MKYQHTLSVFCMTLLIGLSATIQAEQAAEAAREAQLEAEYQQALAATEAQRASAEAALARTEERALREAELAEMHEELNRARRELQEASRQVARVDREIARERARGHTANSFFYQTTQKPVIGVILGDSSETGIEVIGVSPDGPAERAGIEKGDVLIVMGGQELGSTEAEDSDDRLKIAKGSLKDGETVVVTYMRDGKLVDVNVTPEVREPLGWHTITRFPSVIGSPDDVVTVERIVVPELSTQDLAERIESIKIEVAERAKLAAPRAPGAPPHPEELEFQLHELSELGNTALHEATLWIGLPMTRGLKLAEIDPGLGEYFKTDRGVLVLKAREDNGLQLESGDVILDVGDTEVNSPAEFMRALREVEPGAEVAIDIKRDRKNRTLKTTMPERKLGYFFSGGEDGHTLHFNYSND